LEWLEGLGQNTGAPTKFENFSGIFGEFSGYLEWLGPNRKYLSETEGAAAIFRMSRDFGLIYNKLRGFFANCMRFNEIWNYFSMVKLVDRVHGAVDRGHDRVHGGTGGTTDDACGGTLPCGDWTLASGDRGRRG
jgi:hypothetical protein